MYCEKCKKQYYANEKFCEVCGNPLVDELDIYAKQLLEKDESAFDKIYNNTKVWVMKEVSMKLFNEQDRMDCMQEIYFKLFNKIELYHPEKGKFRPWFNTLVSNQITDYMRKSMYEPQIENDDETLSQLVDPTPIPEIIIEKNECTRLLHEIICSLPEEQRECIEKFYIEGRRRKEIAELLELSEETIKSRLRLAREKIERSILDLERAGTKIYGLSPFTFFLLLNAQQKTEQVDFDLLHANILKGKQIAEQIASDTALIEQANADLTDGVQTVAQNAVKAKKVAATVGKTAASKAGKVAIHKTFVTVLATAVIGGGSVVGYKVIKQQKKPQNPVAVEQTNDKGKETIRAELQSLIEKIDQDFLKGMFLLTPEYKDIKEMTTDQLIRMVYTAGYSKNYYLCFQEEIFGTENVVSSEDVIETIPEEECILLKQNAFKKLYEAVGADYHNITKDIEKNPDCSVEEEKIKLFTPFEACMSNSNKVTDISFEANADEGKIMVAYTVETVGFNPYSEQEEATEKEYVAILTPVDNSLGYVIESKETEDNYLIMNISDEELQKVADSMDMNLLAVLLPLYERDDYDIRSSMESMLLNLSTELYLQQNKDDSERKVYSIVGKEILKGMDSDEYFCNQNLSYDRSKLEKITHLLTNGEVDVSSLYTNNDYYILENDKVTIIMDGLPDWNEPLAHDLKKTVNTKEKRIEIEYFLPVKTDSQTYDWKMKAIVAPSLKGFGYVIESVECIGSLPEEKLRTIATDLGVPEELDVTYEVGKPYYWDAGEMYVFSFQVYHNNEMIAGCNYGLEKDEMTTNILRYSGE